LRGDATVLRIADDRMSVEIGDRVVAATPVQPIRRG